MRTIEVNVTSEDISQGRSNDCFGCPIARALNRSLGRDDAWVGQGAEHSMCFGFGYDGDYILPRSARDFIRQFDGGSPVEPFKFFVQIF